MRGPRGFSIVELLVAGAVLLLLFGIVGGVLLPALRAWQRSDSRSDIQGNALLLTHRLGRELAASNSACVRAFARTWTDAEGRSRPCHSLALLSPFDDGGNVQYDSDGRVLWQRLVVFYALPREGEFWAQSLALAAPTADAATDWLPPATEAALVRGEAPSMAGAQATRVARFIRSVAFDTSALPIRLSVETAVGPYTSRLDTAVTPVLDAFSPDPPAPAPSAETADAAP